MCCCRYCCVWHQHDHGASCASQLCKNVKFPTLKLGWRVKWMVSLSAIVGTNALSILKQSVLNWFSILFLSYRVLVIFFNLYKFYYNYVFLYSCKIHLITNCNFFQKISYTFSFFILACSIKAGFATPTFHCIVTHRIKSFHHSSNHQV